jgi:hypothetical protein
MADYGHYMGLNLGLFGQMGAYKGTEFRAGASNGFTSPDLPINGYLRRIFYDGENAGGGASLLAWWSSGLLDK